MNLGNSFLPPLIWSAPILLPNFMPVSFFWRVSRCQGISGHLALQQGKSFFVPWWSQNMQINILFWSRSDLVLDADPSLDFLGSSFPISFYRRAYRERSKRDDNWEPHLVDHQMLHLKPVFSTSQYKRATTPGELDVTSDVVLSCCCCPSAGADYRISDKSGVLLFCLIRIKMSLLIYLQAHICPRRPSSGGSCQWLSVSSFPGCQAWKWPHFREDTLAGFCLLLMPTWLQNWFPRQFL